MYFCLLFSYWSSLPSLVSHPPTFPLSPLKSLGSFPISMFIICICATHAIIVWALLVSLLFGFTDILIRKILFHVDLIRFLVHTRQWSTSRLEIYHLYLLPHMGFNSDVILMGLNLWVCFFLLSVLIFPDCVVFTS